MSAPFARAIRTASEVRRRRHELLEKLARLVLRRTPRSDLKQLKLGPELTAVIAGLPVEDR